MNASVWEKVRKNLTLLQNEIDADELLPYLTEKGVLERGIRKQLKSKPTNREKVLYLFDVLKGSPPEKEAYRHLLEALRSSGFDYYSELADKIDATKTESDPSLQAKVDPSHYNDKVRQVLNNHFTNKRGLTTSLEQVKSVLSSQKVFKTTPWSDNRLTKFVCNLFAGIEVVKQKSFITERIGVFFTHLTKFDPKDRSLSAQATPNVLGKDHCYDVCSLSPRELTRFLTEEIRKEEDQMSTAPLLEMQKQEISGKIFLKMDEQKLEKTMPSSTLGLRYSLINIIERCNEKSICKKNKSERFHAFDSKAEASDCYIQGCYFDYKVKRRGKKLAPIRNFHQPEMASDKELRNYIIIHCAIFAAACINERQNGTIHFGVAPDDANSKGLIIGLHLSPEEFEDRLLPLFFPSQHSLIKAVVRNARFIPVVKDDKYTALSPKRYVIEFDVVPGNSLGEEDQYVKVNAKDFPERYKNDVSQEPVYVLSDGQPVMLPPDDVRFKDKLPSTTISQRRQEEHGNSHHQENENVTRMRNYLTGGSNKIEDDLKKIILLSSIHPASEDLKSLDFIQSLQPKVVFDFDPMGYDKGIFKALEDQEEVFKVISVDDFDERKNSKKDIDSLERELNDSNHIHWIFCNGYKDAKQMNATDWNLGRRLAFRNAFRYYLPNCAHRERLLIIMCLFSHSDIFVEACDEILVELPRQWILLSGGVSDNEKWQNILKDRNRIYREDLKKGCIGGLQWEQVNRLIVSWCCKNVNTVQCQIPHSSGVPVIVEKKKINEWSDIEVVPSSDPSFHYDNISREKQKESKEKFYVGGQVEWLNFSSGHVCRRTIHEKLFTMVSESLKNCGLECENEVHPVYLFHDPGAGGTTCAREILWSLKKNYRCCVILRFTSQTFVQLVELFKFKDDSPKPLLVLIDSEDEEKLSEIIVGLKVYLKDSGICCPTFCVLLICFRIVFVPLRKRKLSMVKLEQMLDPEESSWFNTEYEKLETTVDNPKSLIAFNILKENFNKSYIQNTVKEYVKGVTEEKEETILKIVSLINTFDMGFNTIPVSCFDVILKSQGFCLPHLSTFSSPITEGRRTNWEANVSQSFRFLLNINEQRNKSTKTLRVFHKLTAEQIWITLRARSDCSEGDLFLSLLTESVFENETDEMKEFQKILANLIKQRPVRGVNKDMFSPLILSVLDKEGHLKVQQMMTTLFDLNQDGRTAQQIARFYMFCNKFEEAERYANEAVKRLPWNSAMQNTRAQVYKVQLAKKVQPKGASNEKRLTKSELKECIALCMKSTRCFQDEQLTSKNVKMTRQNNGPSDETGYLGELESIELIIKAMLKCNCFESEMEAKKISHKYLVNDDHTAHQLDFLCLEEKTFLKDLFANSEKAMRVLDDKYLQLKEDIQINPLSNLVHDTKKKLVEFKAFFNNVFGVESDKVPRHLTEKHKCDYRSKMVTYRGANSLSDVLQMKRNQKVSQLKKCYSLLLTNVKSDHASLIDFEKILHIVTVLMLDKGPILNSLKCEDVIWWTKQFYEKSRNEVSYPRLEAFLYFALYNFPTEERLKCKSLASPTDLQTRLEIWIKTFLSSKKKHYAITHRDTTLFFLGKGPPLSDIVYQKDLGSVFDQDSKFAWDSPLFCKILRPMKGMLLPGGEYVMFTYTRLGSDYEIRIKVSSKIEKDIMWRKTIYFYLGFCFSGLKAYGVRSENPEG